MKKLLILFPLIAFAQPDTVTIQLIPVMRGGGSAGLGVNLNVGGGPETLFLFDTGSSGLFVDSGQVGGGATEVMPVVSCYQMYSSGTCFQGTDYLGDVTFSGYGITADNALFGNITCLSGNDFSVGCTTTCPPPTCPNSSVCFPTTDMPPTYGTFGAALIPGDPTKGALYTIIAQLPGNLSSGFIVQTGGITGIPMLTIGLTEENTQGFISAQLPSDGTYPPPNGNAAWNDKSLNAITNLSFNGSEQTIVGTIIFDTGATDTTLRPLQATPPGAVDPQFLNGSQLASGVLLNTVVNDAINWSILAGTSVSQNIVKVTSMPSAAGTYMNSGIDIYFTYNVMFDMVNGLLGFMPIEQIDVSGLPNNTTISTSLGDLNGIPSSLVQMGPGNVILTGNNTYSNGTILTGGLLTISSDANLGNPIGGIIFNGGALYANGNYSTQRSISVFSDGGIFYTGPFSSTLSGPLNGTGTLEKTGSGSLIFSGSQGTLFSGSIDIAAGTFIADGSLQSATINVENSGTLMGTGPVGNVNSSGIVNPGPPPEILNVAGNYIQNYSGTLVIELGSLVSYNQLIVGQTAQLNGTLSPVSFQGYLPSPGNTFTIITAGSLVGQFSKISLLWPTLQVVPIYDPGHEVILLIERNYSNPQLGPLNRNQIAFGNMLNAEISDPSVAPLLNLINGISSPSVLLNTYDELIPSQYLSQINTSFYRTTLTLENVADRLYDIHECRCFDTFVDIEVRGIFQNRNRTSLENPFFAQGFQIDLEIDRAITDQIRVGSYGDYTFLHSSFRTHQGTIDNSSGALFGYGCYQPGNWYADLILGGMYNWYRNKRDFDVLELDTTAKSSNRAGEIAGLFKIGYTICFQNWSLDPNLFLQGAHIFRSSFKEHGASLLNMQGTIKSANSLQPGLGLNLRRYFYLIDERLSTLEFYANWLYECLQNRYSMSSRLVDGFAVFTTVSSKVQNNYGFAGANLNLGVTSRLDCRFTYQALFTSHNWLQTVSAGISMAF